MDNVATATAEISKPKVGVFARLKAHPRGFWFVFWGELAERASYYGMRTLLALYLLDVLKFDQSKSGPTVQFFMAACYLLPLAGGFIADHYLGKYKTILYFSIPYILGHVILGNLHDSTFLYLALGLLAAGSGTIKPNISPLMGMIYEKEKKMELLTEAFSFFYAAINIGAFLTSASLPTLRTHYGYRFALIFPTVLMAIATGIFAAGKKYYPDEQVRRAVAKSPEQKKQEREILLRISGIFGLIVFFWMVYDQSASTWIFFARDHMNLQVWPFTTPIDPDQVQALNPAFIVILTPFFIWLWNKFRRMGKPVPDTRKMMVGFVLTCVCMAAMAVAGYMSKTEKISVWWEIIATFVITLSELCVSVVGLQLAYVVATPQTKSTVTGAFLCTVFFGDLFGGILAKYYPTMDPGSYFGLQAAILGLCTVAFFFVGRKFERDHLVDG